MAFNSIEVKGVTKRYGSYSAVDDISLCVEEGSILAFVGPNGAGKTASSLTATALPGLRSRRRWRWRCR